MIITKINIFICIFIIYCIFNLITIAAYAYDKHCAKNGKWRLTEKRLMGLAFFGGGAGAFLGMQIFRHKTKHLRFKMLVPVFMLLQVIILIIATRIVLY